MVIIFVILTFLISIAVYELVQKSKQKALMVSLGMTTQAFPDYQFTPGHLWLDQLKSGYYRLGLDELILRFVGDPDLIHLVKEGEEVKAGQPLAILVKGGKELFVRAPGDARIIKANRIVTGQPRMLNLDPYTKGWLYQLELLDPDKQLRSLLSGAKAKAWINKELLRLREFVIDKQPMQALTGATLQDGGQLIEGVIDHLDQIAVSDFEKQFLRDEFPDRD